MTNDSNAPTRPLRGDKAVTTNKPAAGIEQTLTQSDNPSAASRQDQENVKLRSYTLPAGSRIEEARVQSIGPGIPVKDVLEQAVRPLGMYLLSPPAEPAARVKVAREVLDGYAGLYEIPDFLQVLLALRCEGDELRAQLMSSAAMPEWVPVSDTEFVDSWGSGSRMKLILMIGWPGPWDVRLNQCCCISVFVPRTDALTHCKH